eukprot:TRINITY_DN65658_c6_g1_i1.p1 TRINITY_DN65658_c6_g1~~TRINITY_DN65658_c6_g1_i1.p1  ORF type:complete len:476 (+),score=42.84 TRINITY_DN65658_c6_g1_i1:670-2097(+)
MGNNTNDNTLNNDNDSDDEDDAELTQAALQALLNPDTRNSLAEAFTDVGSADGKLSIEQFIAVLKHFSLAGGEDTNTGSNALLESGNPNGGLQWQLSVPALLFIRFVDRDGDGMISADDVFTTHALILQMSAVFVRAVFRLYVEAIWYPGRQLNFLNLQRGGTTNGAPRKAGGYKVMEEQSNADVVEPPRHITARHVSAVFEKLGYDAAGGAKLFNILCEALAKRGQLGVGSGMGNNNNNNSNPGDRNSALLGGDPLPPPNGDRFSSSAMPNAALVAAFATEEDEMKKLSGVTDNMSLDAIANSAANSSHNPDSTQLPNRPASSTGGYKMDVHDFVRAAEIDKVLVKILLIKPKRKINQMLKQIALSQVQESGDEKPSASTFLSRLSGSSMKEEIHSALFQANLISTGGNIGENERSDSTSANFPIANSIGRFARGLYEGVTTQTPGGNGENQPNTNSSNPSTPQTNNTSNSNNT